MFWELRCRIMRKVGFFAIVLLGLSLFLTTNSQAISIGFSPVSQDVLVGELVSVDLVISGLGDGTAPSLGAFDLDIEFDPAVLAFNSVAFGDPILGDQLDLMGWGSFTIFDGTTAGVVTLLEDSNDEAWVLNDFQPSSFTLASLSFDTLSVGTTDLNITHIELGNADGDPVSADVTGASVSVVSSASLPEPGTFFLLVGTVAAGGYFERRRRRICRGQSR